MPDNLRLQPPAVVDAIGQLRRLADGVDDLMAAEGPNLVVAAPGRDEVSGRVATTLNDVYAAFAKSSGQGADELRQIATTLDGHTTNMVGAEQDFIV